MSDILTGSTNHFKFRELPDSRIILSEECYRRLSGAINLCAYSGSEELEYGTFLYGKELEPNVFYFDIPSENEDYIPSRREFNPSVGKDGNLSEMNKELIQKIENSKYDCVAHIHTHPYIGGTCRYFSNQDLSVIKQLQLQFQPSNGNKKHFFGGLLTVGPENISDTDEISFVYYSEENGWYKITNIRVFMNEEEVPFTREADRPRMRMQ